MEFIQFCFCQQCWQQYGSSHLQEPKEFIMLFRLQLQDRIPWLLHVRIVKMLKCFVTGPDMSLYRLYAEQFLGCSKYIYRCNLIGAELCETNCITQSISEAGMHDDKQPFLVKEKDSNTTILQFYNFVVVNWAFISLNREEASNTHRNVHQEWPLAFPF